MMAQLEKDLKNAATYKELAWEWVHTFSSQVETANKAYSTLVRTYKEKEEEQANLRDAFAEQIHGEISSIKQNLRDLVDTISENFQ